MVDNYSHSHEVVSGSVYPNEFTWCLEDMLTCTSSNIGVVCDQSIIYLHQAPKRMSISQMKLMLHHLMNLKIILQLLPFDKWVQKERNWQTLYWVWNQLKIFKLLENWLASLINIKGFVFFPEKQFHIRIPSVT